MIYNFSENIRLPAGAKIRIRKLPFSYQIIQFLKAKKVNLSSWRGEASGSPMTMLLGYWYAPPMLFLLMA